jgi:hypothetical protein
MGEAHMKRYLLFAYDIYYPSGGQDDVIGDYDSLDEAKEAIKKNSHRDHYEILDLQDRRWISI